MEFIVSANDHTIKLWDLKKGNLVKTLLGHSNCVNSVAFSPDCNLIVSGSSDKSIKLWDKKIGKSFKTLLNDQNFDVCNLESNSESYNFCNSIAISPEHSKLSCCNSLFINVLGLSEIYKRFFLENKAIFSDNSNIIQYVEKIMENKETKENEKNIEGMETKKSHNLSLNLKKENENNFEVTNKSDIEQIKVTIKKKMIFQKKDVFHLNVI